MVRKPTYEELEQRVKELEQESGERKSREANRIRVSGIQMEWQPEKGACTFENLPVAMMWVDTTLAGLMSGVQNMVGTERFGLALQSEGRKSVEEDWQVISKFPDFSEGFKAIANIAAVAGWGRWELTSLDQEQRECRFRVENSWEGRYQRSLGVCWGSGMLAGKMAGYCSKLFGTNCWAEQTAFIAKGDACDEFVVRPSSRSIEKEIEGLLASDEATRADMAVALRKLETEMAERSARRRCYAKARRNSALLLKPPPTGSGARTPRSVTSTQAPRSATCSATSLTTSLVGRPKISGPRIKRHVWQPSSPESVQQKCPSSISKR